MKKVMQKTKLKILKFTLALRRLKIMLLGLYSYSNWRFDRPSLRRRSLEVNSGSKFKHYIKFLHNWRMAAYTATVLLTLIMYVGIFHPIIITGPDTEVTAAGSASAGTNVGVTSDLTLTITVPSAVAIDIVPSATGTFGQGDVDVVVSTNNFFGYTLSMQAYDPLNTTTVTTDLINADRTDTISTITQAYTGTAFQNDTTSATKNKWGYSIDSGSNYSPITTTAMPVTSRSASGESGASGTMTSTVTLGVKIDTAIPNGTYSATLNFTAITIPPDNSNTNSTFERAFAYAGVSTYNSGSYYAMQDMNSGICNYVYTPTSTSDSNIKSIQLIDTRDSKTYWVTKLLDGNCWMTQNLDLNLVTDGSIVYDSTNTDIASTTTANTNTGYTVTNGVAKWTPARASISSTGYGNITTCSSQSSSGTGCWGQTNTGFASGWSDDNNTSYSVDAGYRYVYPKTMIAANTNFYDNGDTFYNSLSACQAAHSDCNAHNMIGNYYNFAAANATNSVSATVGHTITDSDQYAEMPNSICPKGWRLAKVTSSSNDFTTLLDAYGIRSSFNYQGLNAVRVAPLYFLRSGSVSASGTGALSSAGVDSNVWSGSISATSHGYYLSFDSTGILPARSFNRHYGFSVRCVARQ